MKVPALITGIALSLPVLCGNAVAAPPEPDRGPASKVIAETHRPGTPTAGKPSPEIQLQLRAYPDLGTRATPPGSPPPGTRLPGSAVPLGIDLGVSLVTCPDGNREVSALDIGGWLLAQQPACLDRFATGRLTMRGALANPRTVGTTAPKAPARGRRDAGNSACPDGHDGKGNCIATHR